MTDTINKYLQAFDLFSSQVVLGKKKAYLMRPIEDIKDFFKQSLVSYGEKVREQTIERMVSRNVAVCNKCNGIFKAIHNCNKK